MKSFTIEAILYSCSISGEFFRMWHFTYYSREEFETVGCAFKKREALSGNWLRHRLMCYRLSLIGGMSLKAVENCNSNIEIKISSSKEKAFLAMKLKKYS